MALLHSASRPRHTTTTSLSVRTSGSLPQSAPKSQRRVRIRLLTTAPPTHSQSPARQQQSRRDQVPRTFIASAIMCNSSITPPTAAYPRRNEEFELSAIPYPSPILLPNHLHHSPGTMDDPTTRYRAVDARQRLSISSCTPQGLARRLGTRCARLGTRPHDHARPCSRPATKPPPQPPTGPQPSYLRGVA